MVYLNGSSYNAAKVKVGSESRPSLQTKAATPTTAQQTVTPDPAYDGLAAVVVRAVPTETAAVTANGTYTPSAGKFFSQVSVDVPDPPNVQGYHGTGSVSATAYTATGVKLTVAKTGKGSLLVNYSRKGIGKGGVLNAVKYHRADRNLT